MAPKKSKRSTRAADLDPIEVTDPTEAKEWKKLAFSLKRTHKIISDLHQFASTGATGDVSPAMVSSKITALMEAHQQFGAAAVELSAFDIDTDSHFDLCGEVDHLALDARAKLERVLEIVTPKPAMPTRQDKPSYVNRSPLAPINLPVFNGQSENWTSFYQLFLSLVHNEEFPNRLKMQYLLGAVSGRALEIIKEFTLSDENYLPAFELLKRRYDNPRLHVNRLLSTLFDMPISKVESADALRNVLDKSCSVIKALENLDHPIDNKFSVAVVVREVSRKLDPHSKELYDTSATEHSFEEIIKFLETRILILENRDPPKTRKTTVGEKSVPTKVASTTRSGADQRRVAAHVTVAPSSCPLCAKSHYLPQCESFVALAPADRYTKAKELKMCVKCLESGHYVKQCKAPPCGTCQRNHHILLHFNTRAAAATTNADPVTMPPTAPVAAPAASSRAVSTPPVPPTSSNVVAHYVSRSPNAVLPTACVAVKDKHGNKQIIRVLLDQCSTDHLITQECAIRLGLPLTSSNCSYSVQGVGSLPHPAIATTELQLLSLTTAYTVGLRATVLDRVTTQLPLIPVDRTAEQWIRNQNLSLSDPNFATPGPIDLLIGVDLYADLMQNVDIAVPHSRLHLNLSKFGWIVFGSWGQRPQNRIVCNVSIQLEKFWEMEEIPAETTVSEEHRQCEAHFLATHTRSPLGRFSVSLPLNQEIDKLGTARKSALHNFLNLERKGISSEYCQFMREYRELGHMQPVDHSPATRVYYLPHHGVHNTRKLRVVFNASAKSESGKTLNDCMLVGPTIQSDLFSILLRFRTYCFVLATDVVKMYRQVSLHREDQDLHRIFWRDNPSLPLREYRLTTVTYGTASAPFLAIRCLFQLASEYEKEFPLAAQALCENSYVDDILAGASTLAEAVELRNQLITILAKGCFELSKWCGNHPQITDFGSRSVVNLVRSATETTKALGLSWNSANDSFTYSHVPGCLPDDQTISKRYILSAVSKIFDPLGLVAPILLRGKLFIQQLWLARREWDDPVPEDILVQFKKFHIDLANLSDLSINRYLNIKNVKNCEFHAFADASNAAMAAVIYVRECVDGKARCSLVCAKSRVAPLKLLSIARKELCAAVIAARLVNRVAATLHVSAQQCFAWSDSTTVLAWLAKPPSTWKPFVANRVAEIQNLVPANRWQYIRSASNPADVASRSCTVRELRNHPLWWNGPSQLYTEAPTPQPLDDVSAEIDEERRPSAVTLVNTVKDDWLPIAKSSTYLHLIRTVAYILRFVRNIKLVRQRSTRNLGPLAPKELELSLVVIVKFIQTFEFSVERQMLENKKGLPSGNRLSSLNPFIDESGVIRVGGRLENATIEFDARHPIILPARHRFATLLIRHVHQTHKHGGSGMVTNAIRQQFWLVGNARGIIRAEIRKCVRCIRHSQSNRANPALMGQLPQERVTVSYPFANTGIDYAGPITVKARGGRCKVTCKAYIAIFVCFSTKAVHIDVVGSLTTSEFLDTLRRFISRRGKPTKLFSDNGTTFVGANTELQQLFAFLKENSSTVADFASSHGIEWSFIPPRAPEMGGLWEAAVKSVKHHLRRVIGTQLLTIQELYSIGVQVEACLNSRPLVAVSTDANDITPLTPGHFLIGRPITALPSTASPSPTKMPTFTDRWKLVQHLVRGFWDQWSKDYLNTLQQRYKWKTPVAPLTVGEIVIIREDNLPPSQWLLARVVETHPGRDGQVRVATLRTKSGTIKRPTSRIIPLAV